MITSLLSDAFIGKLGPPGGPKYYCERLASLAMVVLALRAKSILIWGWAGSVANESWSVLLIL